MVFFHAPQNERYLLVNCTLHVLKQLSQIKVKLPALLSLVLETSPPPAQKAEDHLSSGQPFQEKPRIEMAFKTPVTSFMPSQDLEDLPSVVRHRRE